MDSGARGVEVYRWVRDLPYDTVSARDAAGLRALGRGNCVAKAHLLSEELQRLGAMCRIVSCEYELPALVPTQHDLAFSSDVHTAVQVRVVDRWLLVDATHDPALADLGLTVGRWDGESATEPAYPAVGPVVVLDRRGRSAELDDVLSRIAGEVEATSPRLVTQYQRELNALFKQARS
ncbi:transglutaminase domain-containing protein [Brachybacterium halotolerans subsp. kimchii]|uniref:transglutaminase domain-containing protein n=1 Tax=Brachybacterium halotolerans TaxID=2795215 RepID=UPI001E2B3523|nr:transglutaminase domain-containing protein [Brachybacterium halotolerans]UEJ84337.1 transglutaminase domain-containing protein [Brachybacterium halotolerans subsp. kimchii]